MSLYSAFYSGLSGLATNANALNVVGNNLSNINTVGFKESSASFSDIFNSSLAGVSMAGNGNPIQFGLGSMVSGVSQNFAQSSFQSTSSALNMAIQGNGFFTLRTASGLQVYTRNGSFSQNQNGYLVAGDGSNVLGYTIDPVTNLPSATATPIQISSGTTSPAQQTKTITMGTNLNSSAALGDTFTAPIQVYDSLGNSQNLTVTYTNASTVANPNTWTYAVAGPGATLGGAHPTGTISFDASGNLTTINGVAATAASNPGLTVTWANGSAANQPISLSMANNITQYSATSATNASSADGYAAGTLQALSVDNNGIISGTFTNGQVVQLAQMAVSTFNNVNGLAQSGNSEWTQTLSSGSPSIGAATQGGRGSILGGNLELSNVDVATEFTNMILDQRGYEANSKIITTTDQLMQVTLALKQ
jgi:flagellar hook protein FlgE